MADIARLLETMRPMREPPPPPPILPVLVMVTIGCVVAVAIVVAVWQVRRRRLALRAAAEEALAASRRLAPDDRLAAQASLLRRLVRHLAGDEAARAEGTAWLARLDQVFGTRFFTQGEGVAYGENLYRPSGTVDVDALERALRDLLGKLEVPKVRAG